MAYTAWSVMIDMSWKRDSLVNRNVEEPLDLRGVQIHGLPVSYTLQLYAQQTHDDVVASRRDQHVGDELGGNGRSRLVLLVLPGVKEVRDDGRNPLG